MNRRFSLLTLLIALTWLSIAVGVCATLYRLRSRQAPRIEVVYDYGKFRTDVPRHLANALERGTDFELVSLHPFQRPTTPTSSFHGWRELGRAPITDQQARNRLIAAFRGGVNAEREDDDCFEPRHAIRVKHKNETIEFIICFDCGGVIVYVDAKRKSAFTVTETPQPEFDGVLKAAGVELAPSARN